MQTTAHSMDSGRIRFYRSIQGQLMIWFLVLGLIPLGVMGGISYWRAQSALHDQITNSLEAVANAKMVRVDAWITARMEETAAIVALPGIAGDADDDTNNGISVIGRYRSDADNQHAYQQAYNQALGALNANLNALSSVTALNLMDTNGRVLVSTNPDLIPEGSNIRDVPTVPFDEGLREPTMSDVVKSVDGTTLIVIVTRPVIDPDGNTVGVLSARISLASIFMAMADYTGLGKTGESYLVDMDAIQLMTPSRELGDSVILQREVDTRATQNAARGNINGTSEYKDYRDKEVLGAWRMVTTGPDWLVITEIDQEEAFKPVTQLAQIALGVGGGAL